MITVADTYPPVGDNGIDLVCQGRGVCPSTKTDPEAAQPFWQVLFDNLRRLAGVSGAEARCQNPDLERSRRGRILEFEAISGVNALEIRILNKANGSRKSLFM